MQGCPVAAQARGFSPGYVSVAIAAGHVQGRPPILIFLVDVCAIFNQELDAVQVSSKHSFVEGCHA